MVSKRKRHKNAQIRAARRRKKEREAMIRWAKRQKTWSKTDRIIFYTLLLGFVLLLLLSVYILIEAVKAVLEKY